MGVVFIVINSAIPTSPTKSIKCGSFNVGELLIIFYNNVDYCMNVNVQRVY